MPKIDSLRRFFLPCCCTSSSSSSAFAAATSLTAASATTKKRLSASLRDDIPDDEDHKPHRHSLTRQTQYSSSSSSAPSSSASSSVATTDVTSDEGDVPVAAAAENNNQISQIPPRPSKSMVISTFFGRRRARVWFCVQLDRLSTKPSLLLELSLTTHNLLKEMRSGLLRMTLECHGSEIGACRLHSVPFWTLLCNGRRVGFAVRRKPNEETQSIMKQMQSITVGAGVLPPEADSDPDLGEMVYMRANYEWVVGGPDSESFHLINPDDCSGQELSVFLLRSW
ncbi:hypothetical protein Dimus_012641 [Dionaea muscipula]